MTQDAELEIVQAIIGDLLTAQKKLRDIAPGYPWAITQPLRRDYGHYYAAKVYKISSEWPFSAEGYRGDEARTEQGSTVEIRTTIKRPSQRFRVPVPDGEGNTRNRTFTLPREVRFQGNRDLLLVLEVDSDGTCVETYFGPPQRAIETSKEAGSGWRSVGFAELRALEVHQGFPE
jgi:hypothetical protein